MSELVLADGTVVWTNPADLGHFGIKVRKQIAEQALCDRLTREKEPTMLTPELNVQGTVTAASATAVTITPGVDTYDRAAGGGIIATVVINGTGLTGYTVGDRVSVRING